MPDREALLLMQHKLRDLRATWLQQAAHRFHDAELEPDVQAAAVIKHAATTLYNCASELEPVIGTPFLQEPTGDADGHLQGFPQSTR